MNSTLLKRGWSLDVQTLLMKRSFETYHLHKTIHPSIHPFLILFHWEVLLCFYLHCLRLNDCHENAYNAVERVAALYERSPVNDLFKAWKCYETTINDESDCHYYALKQLLVLYWWWSTDYFSITVVNSLTGLLLLAFLRVIRLSISK